MISFSLRDAASACGGTLKSVPSETLIGGISTDSRKVHHGDLFFALKGDRFDAHQFLTPSWVENVTCAVVTPELLPAGLPDFPRLEVSDVRKALGAVAHGYRQLFDKPVIGITGSNGKTSTKAFFKGRHVSGPKRVGQPCELQQRCGGAFDAFGSGQGA